MKKQSFLALIVVLSILTPALGQQPTPSIQQTGTTEPEDVVRITANLVQVDAVVTKNGKQVTDLHPEDFEIYEDGRPQKITNFSYVSIAPTTGAEAGSAAAAPAKDKYAPPAPPVHLRPEQVRRTIALVVDDLGLSFESTHFVRRSLRKFVDEQMQPGDLVAIVRTGSGVGALQQFTSDKQLLYAAIDRLQWNVQGRAGTSAFAPLEDDILFDYKNRAQVSGGSFVAPPVNHYTRDMTETNMREAEQSFRDEIFSLGTLGALNFIVRGLRELPGRKSVVLVSDSLELFSPDGKSNYRTLESIRRLTDLANRASVVIYTIDARGLPGLNFSSADTIPEMTVDDNGRVLANGVTNGRLLNVLQAQRDQRFIDSQSGLNYLAQQTGGFFVRGNNDIGQGIRRVLDDQKGYYLIGYRPDDSTFDPVTGRRQFHHITVKAKGPGLNVRTRTGFYGITNEQARPARRTRDEQLLAAITSPFASGDVNLRLTSLFGNDPRAGSFMRSLIHVDGHSLTFREGQDGWHQAILDVVAMTFGDEGLVIDERSRTETVRVRGDEYRDALQNGLTFGLNVPIRKPGAYQLRIAVRDAASERVGSANQFIEVPNLGKNRLTLSGMYVASREFRTGGHDAGSAASSATLQKTSAEEGQISGYDAQAGPAVRRFRPGATIDYGFEIYNARLDGATRRPQLQMQMRLFRDNKQVYAGEMTPLEPGAVQSESKRLAAIGHLQLGTNMAPGEYVLQAIVFDTLAKEKYRVATQWIDFEVR